MGDITAEALQKLREIITAGDAGTMFEVHGRQYSSKALRLVPKEIRPAPLLLHTLSGLMQYAAAGPGAEVGSAQRAFVVVGPETVKLIGPANGDDGERDIYAVATLDEKLLQFRFGQYMDPETFLIALQTLFVDSEDRRLVLQLAGGVKAERVLELADDGVSQTVSVRKGISGTAQVVVPNPVTLKPYRTFREIDQPESPFLLRARKPKDEESVPEFALFEADGGAWRLTAVEAIKAYLDGSDVAVIA